MPTACYDPTTGVLLGTKRTLLAIFNLLNALTQTQKAAIWTDFTSGSPPKRALTEGLDAGTVMAISVAAIDQGLTGAALAKAQMKMVAAYIRDNPNYLKNPAFDATINIVGYT